MENQLIAGTVDDYNCAECINDNDFALHNGFSSESRKRSTDSADSEPMTGMPQAKKRVVDVPGFSGSEVNRIPKPVLSKCRSEKEYLKLLLEHNVRQQKMLRKVDNLRTKMLTELVLENVEKLMANDGNLCSYNQEKFNELLDQDIDEIMTNKIIEKAVSDVVKEMYINATMKLNEC